MKDRAIYANDQGKQERHRDQREHLIELNPPPKPRSAFLLRFQLQRGIFAPSHKASPTPGQFLGHVTGGSLEMMVVVQRAGKGIPAHER
jgi:hypothetical protein